MFINKKSIEQEPTHSDPDPDEEGDLVLSLETETGLLTNPNNQHTKGKNSMKILHNFLVL